MGTIFVISSRRDLPIYVLWSDLLLVAESVAEYVANPASTPIWDPDGVQVGYVGTCGLHVGPIYKIFQIFYC